jgi:O-antigen ligase
MRSRWYLLFVLPVYAFAIAAPLSVAVGAICAGTIAFAALVRGLVPPRPQGAVPRSLVLVLLAYYLAHLCATVFAAPYPSNWGKLLGEMWLKLLLLSVPLASFGQAEHVRRAVKLLLGVGAAVAIYGIWQHFSGVDWWHHRAAPMSGDQYMSVAFFGHHLTYGGHVMLLFIVSAAWALLNRDAKKLERVLSICAAALTGLALLWSFARSAQIGALIGILVLGSALPRRHKWYALAPLAAMGVALLSTPALMARVTALFQPGAEETRRNLWSSSLHGILARPWLGFGPGNFSRMMQRFEVPGFYDTKAHAHNDFLMHGVNAGMVGLLAALALLVLTMILLWKARRAALPGTWILTAAVACQAGISVGGLFQVYQTDDEVEMLLYFLLGAAFALAARRQSSPPDSP